DQEHALDLVIDTAEGRTVGSERLDLERLRAGAVLFEQEVAVRVSGRRLERAVATVDAGVAALEVEGEVGRALEVPQVQADELNAPHRCTRSRTVMVNVPRFSRRSLSQTRTAPMPMMQAKNP